MLVTVSVPLADVIVWPTVVITVPLIEIADSPSGAPYTMVPVVVSEFEAALVPAGSPPLRAGRPASLTSAVAELAPAG